MADKTPLVWLEINGVPTGKEEDKLPIPNSFVPVYSNFDSDDSSRDETGYLHRKVIRKGQVAPKFTWKITTDRLSFLLNAIDADVLEVRFFDPKKNALSEVKSCYAQATQQPKLVLQKDTYKDCLWEFECSFIEY